MLTLTAALATTLSHAPNYDLTVTYAGSVYVVDHGLTLDDFRDAVAIDEAFTIEPGRTVSAFRVQVIACVATL